VATESVDVLIVGARCAGSAAAAMFARAGRCVLALERATFPADTLSSHTMFAGHLDEIRLIGAEHRVLELGPPDLRYSHLEVSDGMSAPVTLDEVVSDDNAFTVTSVRRYLLDQVLVDNAREAGAEVREQSAFTDLIRRGGRVVGVTYVDASGEQHQVRAKLVLGADGQFSSVAERLGVSEPYRYSHSPRAAVYRHIVDPVTTGPAATTVYSWLLGTSIAFAFPTTPRGQIVVMFIDEDTDLDLARQDPERFWDAKLTVHPTIAARLAGATEMGPLRITDQLSSYFRHASGPGWALIGDAGHFKDPIIGQGMRDAIWAGRTVCERAEARLDNPAELDRALRRWEAERERECLLAYLGAVLESHLTVNSAGRRQLLRVLDELKFPLIQALGHRNGNVTKFIRPDLVATALGRTLKASPDRRALIGDLAADARLLGRVLWHAKRNTFRSTDAMLELEQVGAGWPRPRRGDRTSAPC
jgi:flavin-dependent dehydrogenase